MSRAGTHLLFRSKEWQQNREDLGSQSRACRSGCGCRFAGAICKGTFFCIAGLFTHLGYHITPCSKTIAQKTQKTTSKSSSSFTSISQSITPANRNQKKNGSPPPSPAQNLVPGRQRKTTRCHRAARVPTRRLAAANVQPPQNQFIITKRISRRSLAPQPPTPRCHLPKSQQLHKCINISFPTALPCPTNHPTAQRRRASTNGIRKRETQTRSRWSIGYGNGFPDGDDVVFLDAAVDGHGEGLPHAGVPPGAPCAAGFVVVKE